MTDTAQFRFDPETHRYFFGPRRVTGITEALSGVGLLAPLPENGRILRNFKYAGERGTAVHSMCAIDDKGECDKWDMDPSLLPYLEAWRAFKYDTGFKPLHVEEPMGHSIYMFGGTPDVAGTLPGNPGLVVVERKTRDLKDEDGFQLALQEVLVAHNKKSPVLQAWAVRLSDDGTYRPREYKFREHRPLALAAVAIQNEKIRRGLA